MLETRDSIFASWSSNASSFRMRGSRCLEFRSSRIQKARFSERMMLYSHVAVQIFAPSISACGAVFESSGFAKLSISLNRCFHVWRFILHDCTVYAAFARHVPRFSGSLGNSFCELSLSWFYANLDEDYDIWVVKFACLSRFNFFRVKAA